MSLVEFTKGALHGVLAAAHRALNSVQRVPLYFWIYLAVVGYVYKRMLRDFLGIGTKKCKVLGRVTLDLTKEEEQLLASVVNPDQLNDSFDTVGGLDEVKGALTESVVWPYQHPELLEQVGAGSALPTGVLLHGPPGTGKTLLARALAKELGCYFIEVSVEKLFSKYVGESEKLAAAVFSLAHKLQDCVIFVDEIDSLLSARGAGDSESSAVYTHAKTIFMTKWDGLSSAETDKAAPTRKGKVLVLGATNRMDALDDAILRRLSVRLHVPPPPAEARREILSIQLSKINAVVLPDAAVDEITRIPPAERPPLESDAKVLASFAAGLAGYTGSDIRELVKAALMISFRGKVQALRMAAQQNQSGQASGAGSSAVGSGATTPSGSMRAPQPASPSSSLGSTGGNGNSRAVSLIRESDIAQAKTRVTPSAVSLEQHAGNNGVFVADPVRRFLQRAAAQNGNGRR